MTQDNSAERRIPPVGNPEPPTDPEEDQTMRRLRDLTRRSEKFDPKLVAEGRKDLRVTPQSTRFTLERLLSGRLTMEEAEGILAEREATRESQRQKQIARLTEQIDRLGGQAMFDQLTGLSNRRSFEMQMEQILRSGKPFGIVYADIDRFKLVNDQFGHSVGDLAIKTAGKTLEASLAEGATVFRIGGDEFVILDLTAQNEATLLERTELSRAQIAAQSILVSDKVDTGITMSFGGGIFRGKGKREYEEFKDRVDKEGLLDGAKKTRNAVVIVR